MDLNILLLCLYFSLVGAVLGTFTGLTPGIHVNTLALGVMLSLPFINGDLGNIVQALGTDPSLVPVLVSCMLISAAVVHSFLDFIPSVFFGAPEESESLSTLPGHRLLWQGRGLDAVISAASGSLIGALMALCLCPLIMVFLLPPFNVQSKVEPLIPGLLLVVSLLIITGQRDGGDKQWRIDVKRVSINGSASVQIVPRDGHGATVSGMVRKRHLRRPCIIMEDISFVMRGYRGPIDRIVTIVGVWRVRRMHWRQKATAACIFIMAGALGLVAMQGRPQPQGIFDGFDGNLLLPLLTGLFAMPALLESSYGGVIPDQQSPSNEGSDLRSSFQGALAGLYTAWVPGVTATAGTILGGHLGRKDVCDAETSARRFINMTASVGTAATVFGILALVITGQGGTGVLVAVSAILSDGETSDSVMPTLSLFLFSALVASVAGYVLTVRCGIIISKRLEGTSSGRSSRWILLFEFALVLMLSGLPGMTLLIVSTIVGCLPPRLRIGRICLTGCLIVPLMLIKTGSISSVLGLLGGA